MIFHYCGASKRRDFLITNDATLCIGSYVLRQVGKAKIFFGELQLYHSAIVDYQGPFAKIKLFTIILFCTLTLHLDNRGPAGLFFFRSEKKLLGRGCLRGVGNNSTSLWEGGVS
jgi:hypothetical protein